MALDLFALALKITTSGATEAKAALAQIDAAGKKTAATFQGTQSQVSAGFATYEKLEKQFRSGAISADQLTKAAGYLGGNFKTLAQASIASVAGMEAAGAAMMATRTTAISTGVAVGLLRGGLLLFAGGAALTALVTGGIKLITWAYRELADSQNAATTTTTAIVDKLLEQKQKLFELSDGYKEATRMGVLFAEMLARQKVQDIGGRWFGNRKVFDEAQKDLQRALDAGTQLARNAEDDRIEEIKRKLAEQMRSWDLEKSFAADQQRWADEAKQQSEEAKRAAEAASRAFDDRIKTLIAASVYDDLRFKALSALADIESILTARINSGNLSLAARVKVEEQLLAVQEARARKFINTTPTGPQVVNTPGAGPSSPGPMPNVPGGLVVPITQGPAGIINEAHRTTIEAMTRLQSSWEAAIGEFSQVLGDGIYNAFAAAFSGEGLGGIMGAFGKTILAGLGGIFSQMGQAYLSYGLVMAGLVPSLFNPITSGATAIAIGVLLTALGGALGAIGKGGGGRGTAGGFAYREPGRVTEDLTRFKFIDRAGNLINGLTPKPTLVFNVFGPNDPNAQRAISDALERHDRRRG